jgi:membrane protein implicated in regulation of membrane protease activity
MLTPRPFLLPDWHRKLLLALRLPFWFACFLVVVGVVWRPPLASVGLILFFLVLLVAVEWLSRRWKKKPKNVYEPAEQVEETMQQQITRSKTTEGLDRLDGTFWAEFPAEAMTAAVHVSFCPAFERVPTVQVFPINEPDAQLRIISPKTFGVRVDVKRNNLETDRLCFAMIAEE